MDYIAPLNRPATIEEPRPAYFDGNAQTGQEGSYPSGRALEYPIREILAVIEAAGLTPNNSDLTQLLQAINLLVALGGGGGGAAPSFLLNPIFPHVTVNGGLISVAASNGQVQIAAGQTFVHRGGVLYNTTDTLLADRTKTTVPSKTYHLRWRHNGGAPLFILLDLADVAYNPGLLPETHANFDTAFDDMLIARVDTDAANMPTVTALLNRHSLARTEILTGASPSLSGQNGANFRFQSTLNWARSPATYIVAKALAGNNGPMTDMDFNIFASNLPRTPLAAVSGNPTSIPITRYGLDCVVQSDGISWEMAQERKVIDGGHIRRSVAHQFKQCRRDGEMRCLARVISSHCRQAVAQRLIFRRHHQRHDAFVRIDIGHRTAMRQAAGAEVLAMVRGIDHRRPVPVRLLREARHGSVGRPAHSLGISGKGRRIVARRALFHRFISWRVVDVGEMRPVLVGVDENPVAAGKFLERDADQFIVQAVSWNVIVQLVYVVYPRGLGGGHVVLQLAVDGDEACLSVDEDGAEPRRLCILPDRRVLHDARHEIAPLGHEPQHRIGYVRAVAARYRGAKVNPAASFFGKGRCHGVPGIEADEIRAHAFVDHHDQRADERPAGL